MKNKFLKEGEWIELWYDSFSLKRYSILKNINRVNREIHSFIGDDELRLHLITNFLENQLRRGRE